MTGSLLPPRPLALALAVLLIAGCGGDPFDDASAERSPAGEMVAAAEHLEVWSRSIAIGLDEHAVLSGEPASRAASLLAELDFRLRNHVVTVAEATSAHIRNEDSVFAAATEVVDENRAAIVSRLTELYDAELASGFEDRWRILTEQAYRYARGVRAGDEGARQEAVDEMKRLAGELAEHLSDMTGGLLDAATFEEALIRNLEATTRMIERQQPGDAPWARALLRAAETMAEPAELLAAALAQDNRLGGEADADASALRAELSAALAGTAWLIPLVAGAVGDEPQLVSARQVLELQTEAVQRALERAVDAPAAAEFATLWHVHHGLFEELAEAIVADGDVEPVRSELESWASATAELLEDITDGALDASSMEQEADAHVRTIEAVIRAQVGGA